MYESSHNIHTVQLKYDFCECAYVIYNPEIAKMTQLSIVNVTVRHI